MRILSQKRYNIIYLISALEWGEVANCGEWSGWYSRDTESGLSDNEKISEYIKYDQLAEDMCEVPNAVQVK